MWRLQPVRAFFIGIDYYSIINNIDVTSYLHCSYEKLYVILKFAEKPRYWPKIDVFWSALRDTIWFYKMSEIDLSSLRIEDCADLRMSAGYRHGM